MINLKLSAGLGNNMFQYAAVRTLAESKNYRFSYFPVINYSYYKKHMRSFLLLKKIKSSKQINLQDISKFYKLSGHNRFSNFINKLLWLISFNKEKKKFSPKRKKYDEKYQWEIYDDNFFNITDWSCVHGSFQTPKYFSANRSNVLKWFSLRPYYKRKLNKLDNIIPVAIENRCCVHVRRGDYLSQDKNLSWDKQGWVLPIEYYKYAIGQLPIDLFYVFVSDDSDFVEREFNYLKNKIILKNNPDPVDMFMFTVCKYNIIANSTFSWWGAWLNSIPNKQIYAPKYNVGWAKRVWLPWDMIVNEPEWQYIDILDLIKS